MISTKGLELTNFINPDLAWKTVSKGCRSGTRRSRKQVDRSPKSDADMPDKGTESPSDTTVSESEKLGVAVLGQRFSEKIELVPIKKRRFTVRSLSPPRYLLPLNKDDDHFMEAEKSSKKSQSKKASGSTRRRKANQINSEDFSGIEILAAAACNNNMGDDINHDESFLMETLSQDKRDESITGLPLEESISLKETTHSSQMDLVLEGAEGDLQNNTDVNYDGPEDCEKDVTDDKALEKSVSSRDVRLHWDLNVEMEAWETPSDTDPLPNAVEDGKDEKLLGSEACELHESRKSAGDIALPVQSDMDQVELRESSSCTDRNEDNCIATEISVEYMKVSGSLAETSQVMVGDVLTNSSPCLVPESVNVSELKVSLIDVGVKKLEDDNASKIYTSLRCENLKMPQKMTGLLSSYPLVLDRKVEGAGICSNVPTCEGAMVSIIPALKVETKADEHVSVVHPVGGEEVSHKYAGSSTSYPAEVSQNSSIATEVTKVDNSPVLKASDKQHTLVKGNSKDFDPGYDSQYEDGELRESDAPPYWEEVDYEECVDYGSDTCDDTAAAFSTSNKFGTQVDCGEEVFFGREKSVDVQIERVFGSGFEGVCEHGSAVDALQQKPAGPKIKPSGSDGFSRGSEISPKRVVAEVSKGCMIRKHTNSLDSVDGKDCLATMDGAGVSRKDFQGVELPTDTIQRNESVLVQRSRSSNLDFCSVSEEGRADHSMGKERSELQIHPKSPAGPANPPVNYWDSRRRDSPTFRGPFGPDRSRPRTVSENHNGSYAMHSEGGGVAPADNYVNRQNMNSFSNGSYRYTVRRRSPPNRDDTLSNGHRGMLPMRDGGSPDRRRFRRYPQGVGRGFREYHQRPLPPPNDSGEYSPASYRIVRRDQNSPPPPLPQNRGPVYFRRPYKRSQSRSRSRSPGGWIGSRDQHEAAKHRNSRSPEYRFEPRMQRMRMPFQKQNFGTKYDAGFVSPQRRRFSPQHTNNNNNNINVNNNNNSRWFDDQSGGSDFRGSRRFPARTFQQGQQRFDSMGSSRRMNSDDYYEPAIRPARFSDMGRGRGVNRRFDGSDDERRRPDNGRYDMYRRLNNKQRCDSDGLRRTRFDEDDSFVSRNINNNNGNFNDSDTNNNSGGERRPRNGYMGELVKRKAN